MKRNFFAFFTILAAGLLPGHWAQAQTLVDSWTYAGGGLDPATYEGNYKPATLLPDADADSGAAIAVANYGTATGLGSSTSAPDGYGYFYTFFSSTVTFTLETSNVLGGVETITLSFWSGGNTAWSSSFLSLNYNASNSAVAASGYFTSPGEDSEYGPVTYYTWVWNVSELGESDGFSIYMPFSTHTPIGDISLTQAVPEPSTFAMIGLGGMGVLWVFRRRFRRSTLPSA